MIWKHHLNVWTTFAPRSGNMKGLSTNDSVDFLADYSPIDELHFLTELAGLSQKKLPIGSLKEGDSLQILIARFFINQGVKG
jgi:hypothetical protein